ncbi:glycosyltransferase [Allonocardiopsis opalescens]|uniref:UDP:flavonoid glycosyltransferase YjiC (YdhE family) n=1 Tax=Allonocardiopsis opalescens TaxID=1144618 RepID=A0A2T0QAK9_9ACTN|nr:glycosyltransferase [Allonocardiopsis opalescens]PRY00909.1 UDP:flavonoid glycosyltransferase YjiC (YdhE family) [Allonocardiopsis opalescens]
MAKTITLIAVGTRGDTQPYVALGRALTARGYLVRLAANKSYAGLVTGAGLEHIPLGVDPQLLLSGPEGQELLSKGHRPLRFLRGLKKLVAPVIDDYFAELEAAGEGADAVVYSTMGFMGSCAAERDGRPTLHAQLQPMEPTREFPVFGGERSFGKLGNRLSYTAFEQVAWHLAREATNRGRSERIGLDPIGRRGAFHYLRDAEVPVLAAFSPTLVPRPMGWKRHVHITGFWFHDAPDDYRPSPELAAFLAAGPPPVYVGFGSMVPPEGMAETVREGVRRAGVRAIILGDPREQPSDDQFHVVSDVPHNWLFPRVAAVVHHGGAGTTAAGLRAGAPTIICPFISDQPFWGARVHAIGAGPAPLLARKLTAEDLGEAIRAAVADPAMRESAAAAGRMIKAERGADVAADVIEDTMGAGSGWGPPSAPAKRPRRVRRIRIRRPRLRSLSLRRS